ncbi:MAG: Hsp70 family protein, partial [Alphaproteobacteria bacterium]|nr:Hsp70 family protein [Alphaproteobacteria bacterium]
ECSAEIIRQLVDQVKTEMGIDQITGAVITIPASFNQMQSEATLRAAKLAGLERVDLLQEPIAAALTAMEGAKRSGQFLIYDLGGGTFDVALAQAVNGDVTIIAHQGINMLGGRDFDRMIVNEIVRPWLLSNFDLPDNFQRVGDYRKLVRIAQIAAEKAKIELSSKESASIFAPDTEVRLTDQSDVEIYIDIPIKREQLEELIRQPIMQTIKMVRNLLEENNYKHEDIDRIVFIGGPSRTPMIRDMVSRELGIAPDMNTDPMTAVATGAAYYSEGRQWSQENVSSPKPKEASAPVPEAPALSFQYTARTPDEKTTVTLSVKGDKGQQSQFRISGHDWDSGLMPVTDGHTVTIPLGGPGIYNFKVEVLDDKGEVLPRHSQTMSVTRLVAATTNIPAAQTIAVKALDHAFSQENILLPIVKKGDLLPAKGTTKFKSARNLKAHEAGYLSFELFQVEYPERVDLNLCVGTFRIGGEDLPGGFALKQGDEIAFDWTMSDSGILHADVTLNDGVNPPLSLKTRRFYAPQSGEMSFSGDAGRQFVAAILQKAEDNWGELSAGAGPDGGPEVKLLQTRMNEQKDTLEETGDDPEALRRLAEEGRFILQDIARISRKHHRAMLQRRLGKTTSVFNRIARQHAEKVEQARFDNYAFKVQKIIDDAEPLAYGDADMHLSSMRDLFFNVSWRDKNYIFTWYKRLSSEPYLFPDQIEFAEMTNEGEKLMANGNLEKLKDLTSRMLRARIALNANEAAGDLATIVKT